MLLLDVSGQGSSFKEAELVFKLAILFSVNFVKNNRKFAPKAIFDIDMLKDDFVICFSFQSCTLVREVFSEIFI